MRGRPLRFLGVVVMGWAAARVAMLWPGGQAATIFPGDNADRPAPIVVRLSAGTATPLVSATVLPGRTAQTETPATAWVSRSRSESRIRSQSAADPGLAHVIGPSAAGPRNLRDAVAPTDRRVAAPGFPPIPTIASRSRWSGSAWAIVRDGGGGSLLSPLLGGSQGGMRLAYAIDRERRIAAFARVAAPLGRGPAELALGAQWCPGQAPVTVYAEARALGSRVAPAAGLFGGGATAASAGFRLEGYGQAGVIARDGVHGFGDGQVRLTHPVGRAEAGAGMWAAAQRGAARFDIGPTVALPLRAAPAALRLTLDWRYRIAGTARPASGPVLSLGADF